VTGNNPRFPSSGLNGLAAFRNAIRKTSPSPSLEYQACESILDRLIHNCYRIELKGESMRKKRRKPGEEESQ
jgi:hypothetical protein